MKDRPRIRLLHYEEGIKEFARLRTLAKNTHDIARDLKNWKKIKEAPVIPGFMTFIDLLSPEILDQIAFPVADVVESISISIKQQADSLVVGEKNVESETGDNGTQRTRD